MLENKTKNNLNILFSAYYYVFLAYLDYCELGISEIKQIYEKISLGAKFKSLILFNKGQERGEKGNSCTADKSVDWNSLLVK